MDPILLDQFFLSSFVLCNMLTERCEFSIILHVRLIDSTMESRIALARGIRASELIEFSIKFVPKFQILDNIVIYIERELDLLPQSLEDQQKKKFGVRDTVAPEKKRE